MLICVFTLLSNVRRQQVVECTSIKVTGHSFTQTLNNKLYMLGYPHVSVFVMQKNVNHIQLHVLLCHSLKALYLGKPTLPSFMIEQQTG